MAPRVKRIMRSGSYILKGGAAWREKRSQVQRGFTHERNRLFGEHMLPIVEQHLDAWQSQHTTGAPIDIFRLFRNLITDISFQLFLSTSLDGDIAEVAEQTFFIEKRLLDITPLWVPTPENRTFLACDRALRERILRIVKARRANPKEEDSSDLLGYLLALPDLKSGQSWTDDLIVDEIFSIYFGGSVMAVSLAWAISLLGKHPEIAARLTTETAPLIKAGGDVAEAVLGCEYSNMVFDEVLRLYPPSWGLPRFTAEPLVIGDLEVPARSLVIPMHYLCQHHPEIWQNPDSFDPERFATEKKRALPKGAYFPFGAGPRVCLGAALAPRIIQSIIALMLSRYEIQYAGPDDGPEMHFGFELHPAAEVQVTLSPRPTA